MKLFKKTIIISTFLLLILFSALPNSLLAQTQIDSLEMELGKSKQDTFRAKILIELAVANEDKDHEKASNYAKELLTLSRELKYDDGIANAYLSLARQLNNKGEYKKSLGHYDKALNVYTKLNNKTGMAEAYINMGTIHNLLENPIEALNYYEKALKLKEGSDNFLKQIYILSKIAKIYFIQDKFDTALVYYRATLRLSTEINDSVNMTISYRNIGLILSDMGNYDSAIISLNNYLDLIRGIGDTGKLISGYYDIANVYYLDKKYNKSMSVLDSALSMAESNNSKNGIAKVCVLMGRNFTQKGQHNKASDYLNRALETFKMIKSMEGQKSVYFALTRLDSARGDFVKYKNDLNLLSQTLDSISSKKNSSRIFRKLVQYEHQKKVEVAKAVQAEKDSFNAKILYSLIVGLLLVLIFALIFLKQRNRVGKERNRSEKARKESDELLLNILPQEVAEELKIRGKTNAKSFEKTTVLFTDFTSFTKYSENITAGELVEELNECFLAFDAIILKYGMEKIKTIGDAYMAAGGLNHVSETSVEDVIRAGLEMQQFISARKERFEAEGKTTYGMRVGIHTGPVVAGIIGVMKFAYDIWGNTVNTASRIESCSEPGKVNISDYTYKLVKDIPDFTFTDRGKINVKGKGDMEMYFVDSVKNGSVG